MAAASIRLNEVLKTLSSWGAIRVVATLIMGAYGMNFAVMPELHYSTRPWKPGRPL